MDKDASELYRSMGVRPIVNAAGPISVYGGGKARPEVISTVSKAFKTPVHIHELNRRASEVIAETIGVEAAFVSSGAAGGLVLQAAACIAGTDEDKMRRLPDSTGMRNEIVMQRCQRFSYIQSYRVGGGILVEAGDEDGCSPEQLEAAFSENTAAAAYLFAAHSSKNALPFDEYRDFAHSRGVPLIVDAANYLPPRANMRLFMDEGADMVVYQRWQGGTRPPGRGHPAGQVRPDRGGQGERQPQHFRRPQHEGLQGGDHGADHGDPGLPQ